MKNSTKVQVHVGSLQDMATRFTNAWNQASKGVEVKETNVTFWMFKRCWTPYRHDV
jgi:hypothetical protein